LLDSGVVTLGGASGIIHDREILAETKFNRRQRDGLADVLDKSAVASAAGNFVGLFVQDMLTVLNELLLLLIAVACVSLATWL
jgi:hypothetical protein